MFAAFVIKKSAKFFYSHHNKAHPPASILKLNIFYVLRVKHGKLLAQKLFDVMIIQNAFKYLHIFAQSLLSSFWLNFTHFNIYGWLSKSFTLILRNWVFFHFQSEPPFMKGEGRVEETKTQRDSLWVVQAFSSSGVEWVAKTFFRSLN